MESIYASLSIIYFLMLASLYFLIIAANLLAYIFSSIAVFKLLKRKGYDKPWLIFIPIARAYAFGVLLDKYSEENRCSIGFAPLFLILKYTINMVYKIGLFYTFYKVLDEHKVKNKGFLLGLSLFVPCAHEFIMMIVAIKAEKADKKAAIANDETAENTAE